MIYVNIKCPHCKKNLMNKKRKIDGSSSIEVAIKYGEKRGKLHLSSLYGSYIIKSLINVPVARAKPALTS